MVFRAYGRCASLEVKLVGFVLICSRMRLDLTNLELVDCPLTILWCHKPCYGLTCKRQPALALHDSNRKNALDWILVFLMSPPMTWQIWSTPR